jgi:hypothetical protein
MFSHSFNVFQCANWNSGDTFSDYHLFIMFNTSPTMWFYGTVDMTVDQYKPKLNLQITQHYQNPFGLKIKHEQSERWTRSLICNFILCSEYITNTMKVHYYRNNLLWEVSYNDIVTEHHQLTLLYVVKLFSNSKCLSAVPLLWAFEVPWLF